MPCPAPPGTIKPQSWLDYTPKVAGDLLPGPADLRPDAAGWKGFTGFGTTTFRNSGDFVYNMRDEVHFRERGAHIPRAKIASKPGGRQVNWYTRLEDEGWYYVHHGPNGEPGFVHRTEGSVLTVGTSEGTKTYRSESNKHSVESYVTGRTGISSYSESAREIPQGTDLGEYFESQRKGAEGEATRIAVEFAIDVALLFIGPPLLGKALTKIIGGAGRLRFGIEKIARVGKQVIERYRLAWGGKGAPIHGHIYPHTWYKPWLWTRRTRHYHKLSESVLKAHDFANSLLIRLGIIGTHHGISSGMD